MKDWVIEATPSRDRPFVRTFLETQMFQVCVVENPCNIFVELVKMVYDSVHF